VNITVKNRSRQVRGLAGAVKEYAESKIAKLPRYYDNVQSAEVVLDMEAEHAVVEMIVTARRKATFVATHRGEDMYASIDLCLDKITEQLRRHKDRVRDRQGPPHSETLEQATE
jgi:putative sigma-54 modulation protein